MDFNKYKMPNDSYPDRPKRPTRPKDDSAVGWKIFAVEMEKHEDAVRVYRLKLDEYRLGTNHLEDEFWKDAFKELGIPINHPKASLLRSKAWEHGHANGFSEVYFWLQDLWELVK